MRRVTDTLYDFLAEESFNSAPLTTQQALLSIALLPSLSDDTLESVFGNRAETVLAEAARTGLLYLDHRSVELHPLARAFLFEKLRGDPAADPRIHAAIEHAIGQAAWDEAFALIEAFQVRDVLDRLMTASFTSLLAEGRVETLERFMRYSVSQRRGTSPLIDLIDAEISFRDGLLDQAQALAVAAAEELSDSHPLKAHGYVLAGTSALARFRVPESYALHVRALEFTRTPQDERNALWGQCLALIYLEDDASIGAVHRLSRLGGTLPEDRLRAATAHLLVARLTDGFRDVGPALAARTIIERVQDPRVRTSYGNVCGYVLALQGRYNEAEAVVDAALIDADTYRLTFARPHLRWTKALVALGRRRFAEADAHLRSVEALVATTERSAHFELNTRALRTRMLLVQHRGDEAVAVTAGVWDSMPTPAMYGEYLATQALALAATRDAAPVPALLREARGLTSAVEVQTSLRRPKPSPR